VAIARLLRANTLRARRAGWRSVVVVPPRLLFTYPAFHGANYVGFQVASMAASTLTFAALIALAATPLVLIALGVIKLSSLLARDALVSFFGPLLILRLAVLLLAQFFATDRVTGDVSRLRTFVTLEFLLLFLNVIGGWVLVVLRLADALARTLIGFARLDRPVAAAGAGEGSPDPGYIAYVAMLRVTHNYQNPVPSLFSKWLIEATRKRMAAARVSAVRGAAAGAAQAPPRRPWGFGVSRWTMLYRDAADGTQAAKRRRTIRNRFWLWITLANNPSIRHARNATKTATSGGVGVVGAHEIELVEISSR
jgi:hypothetical protein